MGTITERGMSAAPRAKDQWLTESFARGCGAFLGRITTTGERRFYYRYTNGSGKQVRHLIGAFREKGDGAASFTVQQARAVATGWSVLYRNGVRDLREHFAAQAEVERTRQQAEAIKAADELAEQQQAEAERQRRLTVRQLAERWREVELQPHTRADDKRVGRKDGGALAFQQFERYLFPTLGDRFAADVTRADILSILDGLRGRGLLRSANMLLTGMPPAPPTPLAEFSSSTLPQAGGKVHRERH